MIKPTQETRFEYKGFPCVVLFQWLGHRCGYIGIPKNHKFYNVDYMELDISCHGGLTYSESYLYGQEDGDIWWIGFDCGHYVDKQDYESVKKYYSDNEEVMKNIAWVQENSLSQSFGQVRNLDYVINECKSIVDQLDNPELLGGGR
mgnify:CR=1 FL=1